MKRTNKDAGHRQRRGFALIVTITLMVLLTIVVVGLLSLSSVSLRAASHGEAAATARNNARLGMMLALGELQAGMGPDRRVSASASAVSAGPARPHLTGVWSLDQPNPVGSLPNLADFYSQKSNSFDRWLVSAAGATSGELPDSPAPANSVELVGELNHRGVPTSVRAERIPVAGGSFAWAVFDESSKASISLTEPEVQPVGAMEVATRGSPRRFRGDVVSGIAALEEPKNLISLETAVIPGGPTTTGEVRSRFHDFTTGSVGLLTDNAQGGLKTDLTSLFEAPTFSQAPFPGSALYSSINSGAPQWQYLYDHYRKYRNVRNASSGSPTYHPAAGDPPDLQISTTRAPNQGIDPSPNRERLLPVIAKLQIVFSIVSHHAHISDRVNFLTVSGDPRGNHNHAVPHLVYDTVITLYNPYDVALDLQNTRIRIWDPPVGFRLAKIDNNRGGERAWYRQEMAAGQFHGLGRFQIAHEKNPNARKFFTLQLTDGTATRPGSRLLLQPGEVKVYSPRVEATWSWGMETSGGYQVRSFFDWDVNNNLGNIDHRTGNRWGLEAVPGWDTRAGLQTDHLSYAGGRPENSKYDFEKSRNDGFVSIRLTDDVEIEAKPQRNHTGTTEDFRVDLLAGQVLDQYSGPNITNPDADVVRSMRFSFQDPVAELSEYPGDPVISSRFRVSSTMQRPNDRDKAGKTPFAMLEMAARTTTDPLDETKPWLFNNPVVEGSRIQTAVVGLAHHSHDVRLVEMRSFTNFPGIEIDPVTNRGYFGASKTSSGSSNVPMHRVPQAPAASLGDLIPANLVSGAALPRVVHALGNSRAHPLIPVTAVSRTLAANVQALDHSYLLNEALWDGYFFSSITAYDAGLAAADGRSRGEVLRGVLGGTAPALNSRLISANPGDVNALASKLDAKPHAELAREIAGHLAVNGPFNVNSTSVDAWRSVLSALRDRSITAWSNQPTHNAGVTPFPRMGFPLAGSSDSNQSAGFDIAGQVRWAGFRTLQDEQIRDLAEAIVRQIRLRGETDGAPFLTLAEFVNRKPGNGIHNMAGVLQTAIDESGINVYRTDDSKPVAFGQIAPLRSRGAVNQAAMTGNSAEGAPPILTQGDLMMGLAPIATVRGDTFKIRSYGEATSRDGRTVTARAWCEAVVQRVPDYVDPGDAPETAEADLGVVNQNFGRRFNIVSFRWLSDEELGGETL